MMRKFALFTLVTALIAGSASFAHAQQLEGGGVDLALFRAPVDSKGHITVNGTDIIGHNDYSFGLILDAGIGLLPFYGFEEDTATSGAEASRERRLLDTMISGTFMLNWGIKNVVVVGAQLPVRLTRGAAIHGLLNDGSSFYNPPTSRGASEEGIGDIQLHAKVRLLRVERNPIGLAAIVRLGIPTGDSKQFTGEPGWSLWPSLVGEIRPHRKLRFSLEAGYRAIFGEGSEVNIAARTCPGTSALMGTICQSPGGTATGAQIAEEGKHVRYGDLLTFGLGMSARVARHLDFIVEGYGSQVVKHFQPEGLSVEGLVGLKAFVHENSYLIIGGGAGVPRHGIQNADYRVTLGFVFEPSIGDADGDGIKDDQDQCPNDPEDFDRFEDEDGCPEPDNDRDRIPDVRDRCPNEPETYNGFQDEDGCPDKGKVIIEGSDILILEKVQFETGSAKILPESNAILDAVAATLKGHPEFLIVEVAGHADERASDEYNLNLTRARAASVVQALRARGISASRLISQGYGEYCPIDEASNPIAWEKNRRVEFKVVRTEEGDTGVKRGCERARAMGIYPPKPPGN